MNKKAQKNGDECFEAFKSDLQNSEHFNDQIYVIVLFGASVIISKTNYS
jgi:hypothetical protein